jgi:hypothetical protein
VKGLQAEEEESDDDGSCENEKAEHMGPSALRESGCDAYQHALGLMLTEYSHALPPLPDF